MKYIMLETDEGAKLPILFPDALVHANVADLMKRLVSFQMKGATVEVVSAGFVSIADASVHGASESLKLTSNTVDGVRILAGESVMMIPDDLLQITFSKLILDAAKEIG